MNMHWLEAQVNACDINPKNNVSAHLFWCQILELPNLKGSLQPLYFWSSRQDERVCYVCDEAQIQSLVFGTVTTPPGAVSQQWMKADKGKPIEPFYFPSIKIIIIL